jgi:hypothetical protein
MSKRERLDPGSHRIVFLPRERRSNGVTVDTEETPRFVNPLDMPYDQYLDSCRGFWVDGGGAVGTGDIPVMELGLPTQRKLF